MEERKIVILQKRMYLFITFDPTLIRMSDISEPRTYTFRKIYGVKSLYKVSHTQNQSLSKRNIFVTSFKKISLF